MKKFTVLDLIRQSIIAALYVVLILIFHAFSFKEIQFRIAEILLILILFDNKSIYGLTIGVIIANLFSPMLIYDLTFGVSASVLTMLFMMLFKKRPYIALLMPSLINAPIIGIMLSHVFDIPFLLASLSVFIGEFVVTYVVGLPIYYLLKNLNFEDIYFRK